MLHRHASQGRAKTVSLLVGERPHRSRCSTDSGGAGLHSLRAVEIGTAAAEDVAGAAAKAYLTDSSPGQVADP